MFVYLANLAVGYMVGSAIGVVYFYARPPCMRKSKGYIEVKIPVSILTAR